MTYGLDPSAEWSGALADATETFDLFAGGSACGRFAMQLPGAHNVRNALAAIAMAAEGFGVAPSASKAALASFEGVKRRQELLGEPGGVCVYDDFAHHPTAVDETLRALRTSHPTRSARRDLRAAQRDRVPQHPPRGVRPRVRRGRSRRSSRRSGGRTSPKPSASTSRSSRARWDRRRAPRRAWTTSSKDVAASAKPGDVIAILSNGAFGGIHALLTHQLEERRGSEK